MTRSCSSARFASVESVCCTYKVTCDSTDSFKFHAFTYYSLFAAASAFLSSSPVMFNSSCHNFFIRVHRYIRIFLSEFLKESQADRFSFFTSASRTNIIYNACVSTHRITVYRDGSRNHNRCPAPSCIGSQIQMPSGSYMCHRPTRHS